MSRIVTTHYRYKRPPRKKQIPVALKSAIVIARKPRAPDLTPEEHQRRGDAADALFRELVRLAGGNDR